MKRSVTLIALIALALPAAALAAGPQKAGKPAATTPPAAAEPPAAQALEPAHEYRDCLSLARDKPEEGWEEALAWQSLGGGEPARHCAAVALIGLGKYEEAARRLEALAQASKREPELRADMLALAGQAWLQAGKPELALADQDAGLKLAPGHSDLILDAAVTLASVGQYDQVIARLDGLLATQPNRVEALTLKASAERLSDRAAAARADIDRALVLDPDFPDALIERGMLRRMSGDDSGARADWMRAIERAPDAPAADIARRNLELMDVKVEPAATPPARPRRG